MESRPIASVNVTQLEGGDNASVELAIVRVSEGLQICDENGWSSIGIDLSSALEKLRALRNRQSE